MNLFLFNLLRLAPHSGQPHFRVPLQLPPRTERVSFDLKIRMKPHVVLRLDQGQHWHNRHELRCITTESIYSRCLIASQAFASAVDGVAIGVYCSCCMYGSLGKTSSMPECLKSRISVPISRSNPRDTILPVGGITSTKYFLSFCNCEPFDTSTSYIRVLIDTRPRTTPARSSG